MKLPIKASLAIHTAMLMLHATVYWKPVRGLRRIPRLPEPVSAADRSEPTAPLVSVIVPARNEADTLPAALRSVLEQRYRALEVIVVDDRSEDGTGAVALAVASASPGRARVIKVDALPRSWLGKNHAAWVGATDARGEWLLFTDADVRFGPGCVARAVAYARAEHLDHLTAIPSVHSDGYWLDGLISMFVTMFSITARPDLANDPESEVGVGLGAFNLVRADAYRAIGTHAAISLRPDDDVRLGARIKRAGFHQRCVCAADALSVAWYPSVRALISGFQKNAVAGLNYRLLATLARIAVITGATVLPYGGLLCRGRAVRACSAVSVALSTHNFLRTNATAGRNAWRHAPALPALSLLFGYSVARAAWLARKRKAIIWRGTAYPLEELRSQTGLEGLPPYPPRRSPYSRGQ